MIGAFVGNKFFAGYPTMGPTDGTEAIFALGNNGGNGTVVDPLVTREKYTFTGDICVVTTSASVASYSGAASGNGSVGIFALGYTGTTVIATRDKYTYYGDIVTSATAATTAASDGAATGNSTVGIFALGDASSGFGPVNTRDKYTYSGDVVTTGTVASSISQDGVACR